MIERVAKAGGAPYSSAEENMRGKIQSPTFLLVDPEIVGVVLLEMAEEAYVAFSAGASCDSNPAVPPMARTFGLMMRLGNVDQDRFMEYVLDLPAGEVRPDFEKWLSRYTKLSLEELRADRYWRHFLDPQPVGLGAPRLHAGKQKFSSKTLECFEERWEKDRTFMYINMHFFRDRLREAVENGDLELHHRIEGFDAFDTEHITKTEVAARKRVLELNHDPQRNRESPGGGEVCGRRVCG